MQNRALGPEHSDNEAGKLRYKKGNFNVVCIGRSVRRSNVVSVLLKANENLMRGKQIQKNPVWLMNYPTVRHLNISFCLFFFFQTQK